MNNLGIGIVCMLYSIFLYSYSYKENQNMLGYKSSQQRMNKNVWKISNRCFGFLALIGSSIYLVVTVVLLLCNLSKYNEKLNIYGLIYICICVFVTEVYTLVRSRKAVS